MQVWGISRAALSVMRVVGRVGRACGGEFDVLKHLLTLELRVGA